MMYPLVSELAADGIPVAVTCRVLKLARQPYYRWLVHPVTDRDLEQAYLANAVFDAHRDDPLAQLQLDADDYRWLTREVDTVATVAARGRMVSALEGGYGLDAIGRAAGAHVGILADG